MRLKKRRYRVHIFYLWVPTAELTLQRIKERVSRGGHNVAEEVVRRRFGKSLRNFLVSYRPLAYRWTLFDNSGAGPAMIATGQKDRVQIVDAERYNGIVKGYDESYD